MAIYGSLITEDGDALVAAAIAGGDPVELATIVLGDADGEEVLPAADQTELVNQVYQVSISSLSVDSENPNQILATAVIPANIGGFTIREVGVKTLDGTLFAVGNFAPARKPVAAEGSVWVMEITVAIAIASTSAVTLVVDPEIDYATKQWVIDNFEPKGAGGQWVPVTRILTAGPGLVGGGSLSQNRSFAADEAWFNLRYSPLGHLHDDRYSQLGHSHAAAIASGAAGFMSGADKAKLDGLGAAGMRLLAEASGSNVNYIDLTLSGPFTAIVWDVRWTPHSNNSTGVELPVHLRAKVQSSNSGWPTSSGSIPYPIRLSNIVGTEIALDSSNYGLGGGIMFASGLGITPENAYGLGEHGLTKFDPPTSGQNRYMRIVAQWGNSGPTYTSVPFTGTVRIWGF